MLSIKRIFRDYEDAGSLNSLIAVCGFLDESAFLTKAGHVGLVFRLKGIDYEGLTHAQRAALTHRLEAALRSLDERWRIYQYTIKRTIAPLSAAPCSQPVAHEAIQERVAYLNGRRQDLFEVRLFLVLVYEPPSLGRSRSTRRRSRCPSPCTSASPGQRSRRDWRSGYAVSCPSPHPVSLSRDRWRSAVSYPAGSERGTIQSTG